jgi:PTS system nitrogen regulatory IIA component
MELADMIEPQDVLVDHRAASKAELLRDLAQLAAGRTGIDETVILDLLTGRERLGSTGIGNGIAIPHANVPELIAPFTSLVRLRQSIDFEAIDEAPVDIVFLTLSPAHKGSSHLGLLACIARNARSAIWLDAVRQARSPASLHGLLSGMAPER